MQQAASPVSEPDDPIRLQRPTSTAPLRRLRGDKRGGQNNECNRRNAGTWAVGGHQRKLPCKKVLQDEHHSVVFPSHVALWRPQRASVTPKLRVFCNPAILSIQFCTSAAWGSRHWLQRLAIPYRLRPSAETGRDAGCFLFLCAVFTCTVSERGALPRPPMSELRQPEL